MMRWVSEVGWYGMGGGDLQFRRGKRGGHRWIDAASTNADGVRKAEVGVRLATGCI